MYALHCSGYNDIFTMSLNQNTPSSPHLPWADRRLLRPRRWESRCNRVMAVAVVCPMLPQVCSGVLGPRRPLLMQDGAQRLSQHPSAPKPHMVRAEPSAAPAFVWCLQWHVRWFRAILPPSLPSPDPPGNASRVLISLGRRNCASASQQATRRLLFPLRIANLTLRFSSRISPTLGCSPEMTRMRMNDLTCLDWFIIISRLVSLLRCFPTR